MAESITVARPYTKAAFETALGQDDLSGWSEMLSLAAVVVSDVQMKPVLDNPSLATYEQAQVLIDACSESRPLSRQCQNFVYLLAENKRLSLLAEVSRLYEKMKANQEKSVDVSITSAFDLSDMQQDNLARVLSAKLSRNVNISSNTDVSLLGGVIIRSDNVVIDGSVRGKLGKLAEAMNV
jgi:F-type H+-transporting ATPase subunit delta